MRTKEVSADTLLRQASMTAKEYFLEAVDALDERFGDGYAEKHPDLIGQFMKTAALDYQAGLLAREIRYVGDRIAEEIGSLEGAIDNFRTECFQVHISKDEN